MNTTQGLSRRSPDLVNWLDDVQMSETRRNIAKNQLMLTEALIKGAWGRAS